ncbi:hypothetical protein HSR122_0662 [Halapricum desulfuricans]|uniref:Uncharacterized protein n=1 Tax=Halapricum desulfuricans TaxID=2841257 RepID=A0A897N723_9EURY|nr:hypothetical protein HSR122_0662 [Halapricum desulfuricans]
MSNRLRARAAVNPLPNDGYRTVSAPADGSGGGDVATGSNRTFATPGVRPHEIQSPPPFAQRLLK